jgi:hypothetical protein
MVNSADPDQMVHIYTWSTLFKHGSQTYEMDKRDNQIKRYSNNKITNMKMMADDVNNVRNTMT